MSRLVCLTKLAILTLVTGVATQSHGAEVLFAVSITNGSQMPLSPSVLYVTKTGAPGAELGGLASKGFVSLCQTGNRAGRVNEVTGRSGVRLVGQTTAPILPGETRNLDVAIDVGGGGTLRFETMYGMTVDICGVATVTSHQLLGLKSHLTREIIVEDRAVQTGAFADPTLPEGDYSSFDEACADASRAVDCLRALAPRESAPGKVRFFSGYLPSLLKALEVKYGVNEVKPLLFSPGGAIQLRIALKH